MARGIVKGGNNDGGLTPLNSIIADYVVAAGETLSAGDLVDFINNQPKKAAKKNTGTGLTTFHGAQVSNLSAALIEPSKAIIAFRIVSVNRAYAIIVSIGEGNILTAGVSAEIYTGAFNDISLCVLENTKALVTITAASPYYSYALILSVSGTTITTNTVYNIIAGTSYVRRVIKIDTSRALLLYLDSATLLKCIILSISGTVITANTSYTVQNAATNYGDIALSDTDKVLCSYSRVTDNYAMAVILSISGTVVTVNTPVVLKITACYDEVCTILDTTHAIVAVRDYGNSERGTAIGVTISGTTITGGTPVVFETGATNNLGICTLNSTTSMSVYTDTGNSGATTMCIIYANNNVITNETPVVLTTKSIGTNNITSIINIDIGRAFIAFVNTTDTIGTCAVGIFERHVLGIARNAGTAGQTIKCYDWR